MSLENAQAGKRPEFDLTSISTLYHLIAVAVTCCVLWSLIAVTISV